jgi:hypothetical protein
VRPQRLLLATGCNYPGHSREPAYWHPTRQSPLGPWQAPARSIPKRHQRNPSARSAQLDEASTSDMTCDWRGQAKLSWSQAFSLLRTYKCPVCRSVKHSLVDCPVVQKRGFKVTYRASEDTGADYRPPPRQGAGGARSNML